MNQLSVIIPAAGAGLRMGSSVPKPYIELNGKTILEHTLNCFVRYRGLKRIIIAADPEYHSRIRDIFSQFGDSGAAFEVVEGGAERQHSINNALQLVPESDELVAVHDAVRPFVKLKYIEECCKTAHEFGGAVLGVPAKDTIKKVDSGQQIIDTPDRSHLWQAQTPQVFRVKLLKRAYTEALRDNFVGTDDASLVERIGGKVRMVEGGRENLKITYPIDLEVAKMIMNKE